MHEDRYVPADTNGGWGFAAVIILITALCIATVTYIHVRTYKHPTDVTARVHGEPQIGDLSH